MTGADDVVYGVHMTTYTTSSEDIDTNKLAKIRALLDKAESTAAEFPAEAEALTAKAIEMMERYRIDEAMIQDAAPVQDRGAIIETQILVGSGPYVNARGHLMAQIGTNHSVTVLQSNGYKGKTMHLIGYETDVALTEMLYTSLLVQALSALSSSEVRSQKMSYDHGITFSRTFLIAFADRVGTRLAESNQSQIFERDVDSSLGERSVALVLADRRTDVQAEVLRRYGVIRAARSASTNRYSTGGANAGRSAADRADLSTNRRVTSNRKALSA